MPEVEIGAQPDGGFGGRLRVGDTTVISYERWSSKKEAEEALAEKGVPLVKAMKVTGMGFPVAGSPTSATANSPSSFARVSPLRCSASGHGLFRRCSLRVEELKGKGGGALPQ